MKRTAFIISNWVQLHRQLSNFSQQKI